jgi:DNA-binding transcriptional LysR family regulator
MDIANLKAFVKVAETRSFSLAADQLFLTQPAISKRILQLEEQLGTRLFDRLGKQTRLTRTGEVFLPLARSVLQDMQKAVQQIADLEGNPSGGLSIATSHHIGLHRLPPVLRSYSASYPEVELDLNFMDSEQACRLVERNDIELAVVTLPFKKTHHLHYETIWSDPLVIVSAPGHPLTRSSTGTITALINHPAILPSHGTFTREAIDQAVGDHRADLKIALETNYLETIKMMVSVGLGWSILPLSMLDASLRQINIKSFECSRELGLVFNPSRSQSKAVSAMLKIIRQCKSSSELVYSDGA